LIETKFIHFECLHMKLNLARKVDLVDADGVPGDIVHVRFSPLEEEVHPRVLVRPERRQVRGPALRGGHTRRSVRRTRVCVTERTRERVGHTRWSVGHTRVSFGHTRVHIGHTMKSGRHTGKSARHARPVLRTVSGVSMNR